MAEARSPTITFDVLLQSELHNINRSYSVSGVVACVYSLCSVEGHLKVVPSVAGAQRAVVKGFREEIVHQGAKCHAIPPAG